MIFSSSVSGGNVLTVVVHLSWMNAEEALDSVFTNICCQHWQVNKALTHTLHYSTMKIKQKSFSHFSSSFCEGSPSTWACAHMRTHGWKSVAMQPRQPLNVVRLRTQMCPQYTLGVFKCVLRAVHLWLDHSGSLIPSLSNAVTPLRSNCICKTESSFFNNLTFRREGIILRVPALSLMHHISHSYEMFPL